MSDLFLIIDVQNVYLSGQKWACLNTEGAVKNILRVEQSGKPSNVMLTKFIASENPQGIWKNYNQVNAEVNNNAFLNELVDDLKPLEKKYKTVEKSTYSSLKNPEVLAECRKHDRVVVSGVVAECCVLATVMELIDEGIYTIYLTDAVSGLDRPKEQATELTFSGLSPLHLKMMTTDEYLNEK